MHQDKFVFAQLVSFLNRNHFNYLVRKYEGDKYVKFFSCWNQLLTLMFGQLSNRESLRDLIVAINAHQKKSYYLGFGKHVTKSNLAKANQNRDYHIFEDFAYFLVNEARRKRAVDIFKLGGNIYAFDSTTIDLCLDVFWWAKFRRYNVETQIPTFFHITNAKINDVNAMDVIPYEIGSYYVFDRGYNDFKRLYKIKTLDSFFVIRSKKNLQYKCIKWKRRPPKNILSDAEIELTGYYPHQYYPESLRLIRYWDNESNKEFTYLTNAKHLTAQQIANLYKNRWQVELFFKWLKQHLKIKKFWGTTENAVRIQIYAAISAYCLVAIIQHDMKLKRSTYELLQILSISLTDKTPLRELFDKTIFNNDKERNSSSEPLLFNFD